MKDEFYVGYLDQSPEGPTRNTRITIGVLVVVAITIAILLVSSQRRFARSHFEWGEPRTFVGRLDEGGRRLKLLRPGVQQDGRALSVPLVAVGKFGPEELTADWVGLLVELEGTLIYREGQSVIELIAGSIRAAPIDDSPQTEPVLRAINEPAVLNDVRLEGEIIDSKCYLGVMKPGNFKPHRACAVRCIAGGIPPLLVVRDVDGTSRYYWLEDVEGVPLREQVLPYVAERVAIRGTVLHYSDRTLFRVDPGEIERL